MARGKRLLSNPIVALRDTPVTSGMCILLSLYCFWMGVNLLVFVPRFPLIVREVAYHGPLAVMQLNAWGYAYLAAGCLGLLRLPFHCARRINLSLHIVKMSVLVAWAVSFDLGPAITGQPGFSLIAVVSFASAWIGSLIERRYREQRPRYGGQ